MNIIDAIKTFINFKFTETTKTSWELSVYSKCI